jgi:signal transduction histidine kinase/ActR/RegA family two-component response regulator
MPRPPALLIGTWIFAAYVLAGKLGLSLAFVHASASAVWPPTGIAVAALLLAGLRMWPAILVAAFVVNITTAGSIATSLGIAVGNTLEALMAAALVNRFAGGPRVFERAPDIFRFAVMAAGLSTAVSATIGVMSLVLAGQASWDSFGPIWCTWWLGDAAGALIVTPALVLWSRGGLPRWNTRQFLEAVLLLVVTAGAGLVAFGGVTPTIHGREYPLGFLFIPPLVWAAFRFGTRETAALIVVMAGLANWGTLRGHGLFAIGSENESLLLLQGFLGTIAGTMLPMAAVVAERRRAEEERRRLLEQAQAARADAEEASRAKDQFLAVLSHELRTPLNAMLGWVTILRSGRLEAAATGRALETIERNTRMQATLIEDLLDVSRITAGKLSLQRVPVDLPTVIEAAVDAARAAAAAKSVALATQIEPGVRPVLGDAARLQQIVWNLLSNAVKFSEAGGCVTVSLARTSTSVRIRVLDTGQGISPEFLPHIFDRFRQAEGTTTRSHDGLGLGLAIVRHLVEAHGGTVRAESAGLGQGATFSVDLPPAPAKAVVPKPNPGMIEVAPTLQAVRVLAVDDNADARDLVAAALAAYGAEATVVGSADEALAALDCAPFDVLVADIAMPGRDGYDLIHHVRKMEGPPGRIPALALTAHARGEDRDRALAAGYAMHLAKPVEPRRLAEAVATLSGRGPGRQRPS